MKAFIWYETDSPLHRLNPLTKLALTVPAIVFIAQLYEPVTPLVLGALALLVTRYLGRVPWKRCLSPLRLGVLLALGMFWTGTLFYAGQAAPGGGFVLRLGPVQVADSALIYGTAMAARLLAIFATSLLFVLTTDPTKFLLALIQQARLPDPIGYSVFAAYRFVPLFQHELAQIRAAHQLRGAGDERGIVGRVRALAGYMIPLMAIAVRKGERVALAMDARAFGALPRRTYFRTTTIGWPDAVFFAGALATLVALAIARRAVGLG